MRKELIFAIFAGLILGGIIALGIWRTNIALEGRKIAETNIENKSSFLKEEATNSKENPSLNLTISQPEDLDVATTPYLNVLGLSKVGSFIVISSEEEDFVVQTNEKGEFEQEVELVGGLNRIILKAVDSEGNSQDKIIRIIYSSELEKQIRN